MDEAEAACDTTVILHGGKTRCQGSSLFLKRHLGIFNYVCIFCESFLLKCFLFENSQKGVQYQLNFDCDRATAGKLEKFVDEHSDLLNNEAEKVSFTRTKAGISVSLPNNAPNLPDFFQKVTKARDGDLKGIQDMELVLPSLEVSYFLMLK